MYNGVVANQRFIRKKTGVHSRKLITDGHKTYPNKTKTYGPSTTNGSSKVRVTPYPDGASFVWMQPDWKKNQKAKQANARKPT